MRSRTTPIRSACVKRSNESGGGRIIHSLNHTFQTLTPPPARKFAPVTTWLGLPIDVKGEIYEGLLAAKDVKSGAGQYFTPRPLIEAMVQVVDPEPHQTVHDPACGTAGFLLSAWEHMKKHPKARDRGVYSALKNKFSGIDIVPEVVRLAAMNLYLHGITGVDSIVEAKDALLGASGKR